MKFPIRIRLAIASCAFFLVIIALLEVTAYVSVRAAIRSIVDHELETRLAGLDDHLARHLKHMPWPQLSDALKAHPAFQPELLRIQGENGEVLFEGSAFHGIATGHPSAAVSRETAGDLNRTLRVLTVRHRIDGRMYSLALGTDVYFSATILGRLWLLMVISLPLVLITAGGAGYWISGRAMMPVCGIIAAVRSMDSSKLGERIAVPATGDEIQQLAETVNGMLARIEEAFHRIRQFTANASHELRTPLAIIRTNAEVALLDRDDKAGRSAREALRRILKEAERNSTLLEDMLQLARAGAPRVRATRRRIDLRASLMAACSDIQPVAAERGLDLAVTPGGEACMAEGDEEQIRRLWLILLDNAVKYTPAGGRICASAVAGSDGRSTIAVSDTGIGISPEHRTHIFEPFYRVDKVRSRGQGGAGLGLSIARHIANAHGATIDLESEAGMGSQFRVTFPALAREFVPSMAVCDADAASELIFR